MTAVPRVSGSKLLVQIGDGATPTEAFAHDCLINTQRGIQFSSETNEWGTPPDFFEYFQQLYKLDHDACASDQNALLPSYWTKEDDALKQDWSGKRVWMNPPFGYQIKHFVKKAHDEVMLGNCDIAVCLIPARTETRYFHEYCLRAREIWFVAGRLRFGGSKINAPFPSIVVVFTKYKDDAQRFPNIEVVDRHPLTDD